MTDKPKVRQMVLTKHRTAFLYKVCGEWNSEEKKLGEKVAKPQQKNRSHRKHSQQQVENKVSQSIDHVQQCTTKLGDSVDRTVTVYKDPAAVYIYVLQHVYTEGKRAMT